MKELTNEDVDKVVHLLKEVLEIYRSKVGTYLPGYYKVINEKRISTAVYNIKCLLEYYSKYDSLTPAQVVWAKRIIKNGFNLM